MKAGKYDISVDQGSTFSFYLTYQDSAGTAIGLSQYSASMQVRRSVIDTDLILDISSANGVTGAGAGGTGGEFTSDGGSLANDVPSGSGVTNGFCINCSDGGVAGTTGGILITIDNDTMQYVPPGNHSYDLKLTVGNVTNTVLKGRFEVEGEVTR